MNPGFENATMDDLPEICRLFEEAILFIKEKGYTGWTSYDREFIRSDIEKGLVIKITSDKSIVAFFSICFSDPLIWREREKGDALYLHRIVLNRSFAGEKIFSQILNWAISYARAKALDYIRMDTWADNSKIIGYYKDHGFSFIENYTTSGSSDLPVQHRNLTVALLELNVHAAGVDKNALADTIYIIGAGAIGKTLAVFLKKEGKNVVILRGSVDDQPSHEEEISVTLHDDRIITAALEIRTMAGYSALSGLIIITTKSFGNVAIAEKLKEKAAGSPVVILQNGLDVEHPFIERGYTQLYRCVLFASSQFLPSGSLRFKPATVSPVGIITGDSKMLDLIIDRISNSYFPFRAEKNIQPLLWTKAIANCVFNSICPLLETDNGIFYRDEKALHIAERIISECLLVADAKGIHLGRQEVTDMLLKISRSSDGQLISTYQDIKKGRRTEIDTLNMAVVRMADELQIENMVTETRLLGELVKLKSRLFLK